jgi:hypothetical protein
MGLMNYFPGLALNHDPSDLSLQVAGITDVSHQFLAEDFLVGLGFELMLAKQALYHLNHTFSG